MAVYHCTSYYFLVGGSPILDDQIANNKGQAQAFMTSKINEAMNGSDGENLENFQVEITKFVS